METVANAVIIQVVPAGHLAIGSQSLMLDWDVREVRIRHVAAWGGCYQQERVGAPHGSNRVFFSIDFVIGDTEQIPDGWYLSAYAHDDDGAANTCYYGNCQNVHIRGFCTECYWFLGSNNSIFTTDLSVTVSIPACSVQPAGCSGGCTTTDPASLQIIFHPC